MNGPTLTRQVLDLPLAERVRMAQDLWASIDSQLADTSPRDAALVARERDAEFETGDVQALSHDEVLKAARRRIR